MLTLSGLCNEASKDYRTLSMATTMKEGGLYAGMQHAQHARRLQAVVRQVLGRREGMLAALLFEVS